MLTLDNVSVAYGRTQIVRAVSLRVDDGETVALLGRNGVGKTTLLRAICGDLTTLSGTIRIADRDITHMKPQRRTAAGVALAPQGREIFDGLTVAENLRVGLAATERAERDQILERIVEHFPVLRAKWKARGGSLSGGEQQMLSIARALATRPRLLLLDEPSEGIQPSIVREIVEQLRELRDQENLTILVVEQNLEVAVSLASRAYVMAKGTIVAEVAPSRLLDDSEFQREYLGI